MQLRSLLLHNRIHQRGGLGTALFLILLLGFAAPSLAQTCHGPSCMLDLTGCSWIPVADASAVTWLPPVQPAAGDIVQIAAIFRRQVTAYNTGTINGVIRSNLNGANLLRNEASDAATTFGLLEVALVETCDSWEGTSGAWLPDNPESLGLAMQELATPVFLLLLTSGMLGFVISFSKGLL